MLESALENFQTHLLDEQHRLYQATLPSSLWPSPETFECLWRLHPEAFPRFQIHGRVVDAPRWQQAYGVDYTFSGQSHEALPTPPPLKPYLKWCQEHVDSDINGLLLNWYDGARGHYIGKHRDSNHGRVQGSPIITLSFGETRILRMRPWKKKGYRDFVAEHGSVFLVPWNTNLAWTHEIPPSKRYQQRRISMTARAFHQHEQS